MLVYLSNWNQVEFILILLSSGLEYVYSTAPKPLQAVAMGLLSAVEGSGSVLGTALIGALSPAWIPQDRDYFQVLLLSFLISFNFNFSQLFATYSYNQPIFF